MAKDLGMALSDVLFKAEPELRNCDPIATARAANAVANLLGCILANVLVKENQEFYKESLYIALRKVHDSAMKTAERAVEMAQKRDAH